MVQCMAVQWLQEDVRSESADVGAVAPTDRTTAATGASTHVQCCRQARAGWSFAPILSAIAQTGRIES